MAGDVLEFGGEHREPPKRKPKPITRPELTARQIEDQHELDAQLATSGEVELADREKDQNRSLAAANMRLAGFSWPAIAKALDYSTARAARQAAITSIASAYEVEDHATLRIQESARLDRLLASIWDQAINPHGLEQLQFNRRASEIIEQHAKLHGLNAPAVMAIVNPDAAKMEAVVEEIMRAQRGDVAEEGDIFEMVEDADGTFVEEEGYEGGE